jgi:enoyl reductase-like protein
MACCAARRRRNTVLTLANGGYLKLLLWDGESEPWGGMIEPLPPMVKRMLALDAIELSLRTFRPSFDELFDESTVNFTREALRRLRERLGEDSLGISEVNFFDNLYALQENDRSPGTASIVMAISEYANAMRRELSSADVLAILSACYEAVLNSERIPRVTIEAERNSEILVRLISAQRDLIEAAASA